jgi:hypothetical protein
MTTILLIIAAVIFVVTYLFAWALCVMANDKIPEKLRKTFYDEPDEPEPPPRVATRIWSKDVKTGEWK